MQPIKQHTTNMDTNIYLNTRTLTTLNSKTENIRNISQLTVFESQDSGRDGDGEDAKTEACLHPQLRRER